MADDLLPLIPLDQDSSQVPGGPPHPPDLSWYDIETFLLLYERSRKSRQEYRATYNDLFGGIGMPPTTVIGKLQRILNYLGIRPTKRRNPGFDLLFKADVPGAGLEPTKIARELYQRLKIMRDMYYQTPQDLNPLLTGIKKKPVIRVGATQIFSFRLLPTVLSAWSKAFPDIELNLTIKRSLDLLPYVKAGLLDVAFLFVPENATPKAKPIPERQLQDVWFRSLGFTAGSVVLCNPASSLPIHQDSELRTSLGSPDANMGYWGNNYAITVRQPKEKPGKRSKPALLEETGERKQKIVNYQDLQEIKLADIDVETADTLLFVRSWGLPEEIVKVADIFKERGKLLEVANHDEGLALTRAGRGMTIAPAGYCRRQGVTAFKLVKNNKAEYQRPVGCCYSYTFGLSPEAARLIAFVAAYLSKFNKAIEADELPLHDDPGLEELSNNFMTDEHDWREDFPMERRPLN